MKYEGTELPYSVFDKVRQVKQADIVSNKRLGSVLQLVKEQQKPNQLNAASRHRSVEVRNGFARRPIVG